MKINDFMNIFPKIHFHIVKIRFICILLIVSIVLKNVCFWRIFVYKSYYLDFVIAAKWDLYYITIVLWFVNKCISIFYRFFCSYFCFFGTKIIVTVTNENFFVQERKYFWPEIHTSGFKINSQKEYNIICVIIETLNLLELL